ncbi:MAG: ATP-dependent sacrificial sulfur transferase LarE [Deltaproteobacteria bacterium]|jgi:uncharacterized protein|nr:ATP-dependent sacrificial sulfur transferase LarE [Deltaproteobacteria bacterium]
MPSNTINSKEEKLKQILTDLKSIVVAFSGGVDSSFLAAFCHKLMPGKVLAVTARSESFPERELKAAESLAKKIGLKHIVIDSEELEVPGFSANPPNRCYLCKHELFTKIKQVAQKEGFQAVVEASNADDVGDYRPGMVALAELGILSPLRLANITKQEIRLLSKEMGLNTWDKPSFACLASRFPYGELITSERLKKIDQAESFLLSLGLKQVRVRFHDQGGLARIEADEEGLEIMMLKENREAIAKRFTEFGFLYTTIDLLGYRSGSMNLQLPMATKAAHQEQVAKATA